MRLGAGLLRRARQENSVARRCRAMAGAALTENQLENVTDPYSERPSSTYPQSNQPWLVDYGRLRRAQVPEGATGPSECPGTNSGTRNVSRFEGTPPRAVVSTSRESFCTYNGTSIA